MWPYFVMLYTHDGGYSPMIDSETDDISRFKTEDEAREAAKDNTLGELFGYEIFEIGTGEQ